MINIDKKIEDTKIVVAMSGGVDSSVVATILANKGYQVIGVTLQLYDNNNNNSCSTKSCCGTKDIYDAKEVAAKLNIPHYVLNYESIFKKEVVDDFVDSYLSGSTPIPCVRCNQSVKFRDLFKVAKDLKADGLATGHYVQRRDTENGPELHKGIDDKKDQSYFLFAITKEQLPYLYFPIGNLTKEETRNIASDFNLPVSNKKDSQDICFVPNGNYVEVIKKLHPDSNKPGEIIDMETGSVAGIHDGIVNYTIGQRKRIGIAAQHPMFVIKIDAPTNKIYVGQEKHLFNDKIFIKDTNWLVDIDESVPLRASVRLRSLAEEKESLIYVNKKDKTAIVRLNDQARAITNGQACVIYDGTKILGGGFIDNRKLL